MPDFDIKSVGLVYKTSGYRYRPYFIVTFVRCVVEIVKGVVVL